MQNFVESVLKLFNGFMFFTGGNINVEENVIVHSTVDNSPIFSLSTIDQNPIYTNSTVSTNEIYTRSTI